MPGSTARAVVSSLAGTCDRHPSALAYWIAENGFHELTFCHHCIKVHAVALVAQGFHLFEVDKPEGKPFNPRH